MRKLGIALLALGLCAMALPALALPSNHPTEITTDQSGMSVRSPECLGDIVWDTGMNDTWVRPTGGFSAKLAMCTVNAFDPYGYAGLEYREADDFISDWRPITGMKILSTSYVCADYQAHPEFLHGFCVKFYEAVDDPPYCPDGTITGWGAIGNLVYDQYSSDFTAFTVVNLNKYSHCIQFPIPFQPAIPGHPYWASVTADYDDALFLGGDPVDPNNYSFEAFYWRVYGGGDPYSPNCQAMNATDWPSASTYPNPSIPVWTPAAGTYQIMQGMNMGFKLYDNFVFPNGACCDPAGACTVTIAHDCIAPAIWHGEWTDCGVAQCPQPPRPGACCDVHGACTYVLPLECQGVFHQDLTCDTNPCPQPTGSCCAPLGTCTVVVHTECTYVWTEGGTCDPNLCTQPTGACCNRATGACTMTVETACALPSVWLGANIPCNVVNCPPPPATGACCNVATGVCTITTQAACPLPLVWLGAGIVCNTTTCPIPVPVEHKTWGGVKNSYR